jgi:hypothetical protein
MMNVILDILSNGSVGAAEQGKRRAEAIAHHKQVAV